MKALTIWQPWASLAAHGIKTIETRSWPAPKGLIGQRLAIHAAKKSPKSWWNTRSDEWDRHAPGWVDLAKHLPGFDVDSRWLESWEASNGEDWQYRWIGQLGKVVGSAVLADCVPIVRCVEGASIEHVCNAVDGLLHHRPLSWFPNGEDWTERVIDDQLPFGDFTSGRWAWLLTDAAPTTERCPWCWGSGRVSEHDPTGFFAGDTITVPCLECDGRGHCDPPDATGKQGVWEWTP